MKTYVSTLLLSAVLAAGVSPAQAQDAPVQDPSPAIIVPQSAGEVAAAAQQYVNFLATGDYEAARNMYDLTTNATVTPASIQANWDDIVAAVGSFQSVAATRTVPMENPEGATMAIVTARFENGSRDLYIIFDTTYKIVSLDIVQAQ